MKNCLEVESTLRAFAGLAEKREEERQRRKSRGDILPLTEVRKQPEKSFLTVPALEQETMQTTLRAELTFFFKKEKANGAKVPRR